MPRLNISSIMRQRQLQQTFLCESDEYTIVSVSVGFHSRLAVCCVPVQLCYSPGSASRNSWTVSQPGTPCFVCSQVSPIINTIVTRTRNYSSSKHLFYFKCFGLVQNEYVLGGEVRVFCIVCVMLTVGYVVIRTYIYIHVYIQYI